MDMPYILYQNPTHPMPLPRAPKTTRKPLSESDLKRRTEAARRLHAKRSGVTERYAHSKWSMMDRLHTMWLKKNT